MLMERNILHKHKIENRSKKSFEIFLKFLIEILHFVSQVYFGHISLPSLEKEILEFAFEVDLSIRLQKYATAW
jgi:hypothetical protein